ncbi:MAG: protein kinase [Cyanobacteria bacterium]|nr:protein kinase [Cyanobacteriota bacterium]
MSNADVSYCRKCHKPREVKGTGLITRLIEVCRCNFSQPLVSQELVVEICNHCKRPINVGAKGSITQFVYKGLCKCPVPEPRQSQRREDFKSPAFKGFVDDELEQGLELDPDKFPLTRYKPLACLGSGYSGVVYACRDLLLEKVVAVKALHNLTAEQLVSFQAEARAHSQLSHPNIVRLLDFGATESGIPFMVMERIRGVSLEHAIKTYERLDCYLVVQIGIQLCDALAYAHSHGIFHRDLKPSNILLSEESAGNPEVRLIDFGVAFVKQATSETQYQGTTIAGTPSYMPPDTIGGAAYDERSEIYSLACILFEALDGRPPYSGETALALIRSHAEDPIPSLSNEMVPDKLKLLIGRMLSKNPDDRPQSMRTVVEQLKNVFDETIWVTQSIYKTESKRSNSGILLLLAASLLIMAGGYLIYQFLNPHESTLSRDGGMKRVALKSKGLEDPRIHSSISMLKDQINSGSQQISLAEEHVTPNQLKLLTSASSMSNLSLSGAYLTKDSFSVLCRLSQLSSLNLNNTKIEGKDLNDENMRALSSLTHLKALLVGSSAISDQGVSHIASLPELSTLGLHQTEIGDDSLRTLAQVTTLESLDISGAKKITDRGLTALRNSPLSILLMRSRKVGIDELKAIKLISNLKLLSLGGMVGGEISWSQEESKIVAQIPLRVIHFRQVVFAKGALQELAEKGKTIEEVQLNFCRFNSAELEAAKRRSPIRFQVRSNNMRNDLGEYFQ